MTNASFLSIVRRNRAPESFRYAAETDFDCVPAGEARAEHVLGNPQVSLYCFDPARQQALFVETPADEDLLSYPFIYLAQARLATRLIAVPYSLFFEWAERCAPAKQVALFYSVGRCGSTLLSHLLGGVREIMSVNEPDALTHIENQILDKTMSLAEARPFIRAIGRFWWKPELKPGASCLLMKLRHELPAIGDQLNQEFPSAHRVFMYRHADEVVASFMRMRGDKAPIDRLRHRLAAIKDLWGTPFPVEQLYAEHGHLGLEVAQWGWAIDQYQAMRSHGFDIPAIRYEDLVIDPDRIMTQLFQHWGLVWDSSITPRIMAEDSQKGTPIARTGERTALTAEQREVVRQLLPEDLRRRVPRVDRGRHAAPRYRGGLRVSRQRLRRSHVDHV